MFGKGEIIMKRVIKTASAILLALAMTTPAFAAPTDTDTTTDTPIATPTAAPSTSTRFTDINSEEFAWAKSYINDMAGKGFISGYEDNTFRPDNDVTRLEALSLFARAMGSNDSANTELLKIAHDKFDSVIKEYGLKWGTDEIAYLMYKGALKKTDLDTYLKDDEKDTPMKRYEAAIIITKAMGGEEKALSELGVVLDYTDAREVPSNAIQYVSYATDAGIMEGMGEGLFSPNTAVKRSQMAVMLSRTVDKTNYTFEKNKITAVDTENKTITATNSKGKETQYTYTDSTVIKSLGDEIQASRLVSGVEAVFVKSGNTLVSVDTVSSEPDRTITGRFVNSSVAFFKIAKPNRKTDTINNIESTIPIAPVVIPAIDIPLFDDFNPSTPNIIAKIAQGIDIYHIQERTSATIPSTSAAILKFFFLFSTAFVSTLFEF